MLLNNHLELYPKDFVFDKFQPYYYSNMQQQQDWKFQVLFLFHILWTRDQVFLVFDIFFLNNLLHLHKKNRFLVLAENLWWQICHLISNQCIRLLCYTNSLNFQGSILWLSKNQAKPYYCLVYNLKRNALEYYVSQHF